jgi:hypothetical protein
MTAVPDSFGKTFAEQLALLPPDEEVPSARVVVMGMVIHFLATGECLFQDHLVRCLDVEWDGDRLIVGNSASDRLFVDCGKAGSSHDHLGLASSRKF